MDAAFCILENTVSDEMNLSFVTKFLTTVQIVKKTSRFQFAFFRECLSCVGNVNQSTDTTPFNSPLFTTAFSHKDDKRQQFVKFKFILNLYLNFSGKLQMLGYQAM